MVYLKLASIATIFSFWNNHQNAGQLIDLQLQLMNRNAIDHLVCNLRSSVQQHQTTCITIRTRGGERFCGALFLTKLNPKCKIELMLFSFSKCYTWGVSITQSFQASPKQNFSSTKTPNIYLLGKEFPFLPKMPRVRS